MLHKKKWIVLLFIAALIIGGCAQSQESSAGEAGAPAMEAPMEEVAEEEAAMDSDGQRAVSNTAPQGQVQEQLIIRTGDVNIVVEDTEQAIDAIIRLANNSGGWVVSSNVYQSNGAKAGSVSIRVPVREFDAIMQQIEGMALEVTSSSSSGEDVTEEYVDLSARLDNLEATADRVRGFLDEAQDVEEALAVNSELSRLESEIESLKGRIQYLEQSAAFSTINVQLTPDELSQPLEVGGWRPTGVAREAVETLVSALQGVASIAIWLVIVALPLALIVIIPIWLVVTFVRRRRASTTAAPTPET